MKAIVAISQNNVIGNRGKLPWHCPDDLKWFKKCTLDNIVVMGRKTVDSLRALKPEPIQPPTGSERAGFEYDDSILPRRSILTLSGKKTAKEIVEQIRFIENNQENSTDPVEIIKEKEVWIAGGAQIYRLLLPYIDELYITTINKEVEGDAYFPEYRDNFQRVEEIANTLQYRIDKWVNINKV